VGQSDLDRVRETCSGTRGGSRWGENAEATLLEGMYALVTTLPADTYTTDRVFQLFKEQHYVERSNHILKGHLRVSPVYLKKSIRIEGLLFILWLALVVYLLIKCQYRKHTKEPKQKRRTTRNLLEAFEGYVWVLIKVREWYYRRPSALTADQREIYTALALNPP
jgi:transposase